MSQSRFILSVCSFVVLLASFASPCHGFETDCTGVIGDLVWADLDGDGCQGQDEPGIPDVKLRLFRRLADKSLEFVEMQITGPDGEFAFTDLCSGLYFVKVIAPDGFVPTTAMACGDYELDSDCIDGWMRVGLPHDYTVYLAHDCGLVPAGACCLEDGSCLELTEEECLDNNGQFQGEFTTCDDVDCPQPAGICLVIIDEETIDNDIMTIEDAAASHGVEPDFLVNDDMPTEHGNPPLRWNELFPGDVVLIPGGQVDDEGLFALPPDTPWPLEDYAAGIVPQNQLDKIPDVMPLRNQDLARLIGLTCVAVVYDSDISMNYLPILANLQGERYGLFTFTVLDVVLAGTIPESGSSTSLYDLLVLVEPPAVPTFSFEVVVHDHEPDSIQITGANYDDGSGLLEVFGTSDFAPDAFMTVSIDGFLFEETMMYNEEVGRYEFVTVTAEDLNGRRVTISTDEGGAYNDFIQ